MEIEKRPTWTFGEAACTTATEAAATTKATQTAETAEASKTTGSSRLSILLEGQVNEQGMQHLEMIQNVITRMAQNSFTLKGWAATLVAAAFALASKEANQWYLLVALVPTLAFWGLDAYYLRLERLFRRLYDTTRGRTDDELAKDPFTMNIGSYMKAEQSWCRILWSVSEIGYYGPVLAVIMVAAVVAFRVYGH